MRRQLFRVIAYVVTLASVASLASSGVAALPSGTYGSGAYGACDYGMVCSVTLTTSSSISVNVTPAVSSKCSISSDSVSVLTDDSNGYTLTLANASTNTALVSGAHSIAATSGTFASPVALSGASWGYRIDGVGSFGAGPTTPQANISPSALTFAKLVASNATADTLANTSVAADPAVVTTVWYGVCANTTVPSGTYTSQATYTAVAN